MTHARRSHCTPRLSPDESFEKTSTGCELVFPSYCSHPVYTPFYHLREQAENGNRTLTAYIYLAVRNGRHRELHSASRSTGPRAGTAKEQGRNVVCIVRIQDAAVGRTPSREVKNPDDSISSAGGGDGRNRASRRERIARNRELRSCDGTVRYLELA